MKRREFIELTAVTSSLILVGGMVGFPTAKAGPISDCADSANCRQRMAGGRCSDFRMMGTEPDIKFEREIFDI